MKRHTRKDPGTDYILGKNINLSYYVSVTWDKWDTYTFLASSDTQRADTKSYVPLTTINNINVLTFSFKAQNRRIWY